MKIILFEDTPHQANNLIAALTQHVDGTGTVASLPNGFG
jgi:hypothetical protein